MDQKGLLGAASRLQLILCCNTNPLVLRLLCKTSVAFTLHAVEASVQKNTEINQTRATCIKASLLHLSPTASCWIDFFIILSAVCQVGCPDQLLMSLHVLSFPELHKRKNNNLLPWYKKSWEHLSWTPECYTEEMIQNYLNCLMERAGTRTSPADWQEGIKSY